MKKRFKTLSRLAAFSLALGLIVPPFDAPAQAAAQPARPAVVSEAASVPLAEPVPLRGFAESIGAQVGWNDTDKTATAVRGKTVVSATIGESSLTVNGKPMALDTPVRLDNEKTVVPLGALNEAFGVRAGWDAQANAIAIAEDDYPLLASAFIAAWNGGDVAKARSYMNETLQSLMPEPLLLQYWANLTQTYGPLGPQLSISASSNPVHHNAAALYKTEAGAFEMTVRFDTYGLVDDLFASPAVSAAAAAYEKPAYDDPATYSEKDVVIGQGPFALPGTLTMPAGDGPFPAVVLVHGSGPNDRDESIGAVKPFRDIAVGLAAQGIAVLRYEKATREHPLKSQLGRESFTVREETVDDAVRAIELLRHTDRIDPQRIYAAGHSQGGMLVPRIVDAAGPNGIAGAIVLAGPSRPLEDLLVEQLKFQLGLARKAGLPTEALERQAALYEEQFKLIKDPQYSPANPPQGFMLGNTAWWLDIRGLRAGEEAKRQNVPLLIVQGGNDVQVFPDNLDGWKSSLSERNDVQYKLYPKLNHTLVEFEGESTGAEYGVPANVPDTLIADMANWIKR
ncbi:alpha/beta hydrolase family protein [Paenibacillus sp. GYB003]|uniref:alpha/beta hydrolase family protein n=1 Tax=Paenibacillus sp. GYB003 TaxID=2994392 RepID=UPI002F968A6F